MKVWHGSSWCTALEEDVQVEGVEQVKSNAATSRFGGGHLQRGQRWVGEVCRFQDWTAGRTTCHKHSAGRRTDDVECRLTGPPNPLHG